MSNFLKIEDTLEYIDFKRDSMTADEWLTYLEQLQAAITSRITVARWGIEVEDRD